MTKESDIQIACNEYLNYLGKYYFFRHFHVPNEGKRSISYHAKMKKMGLKSGCPDIIIEYPEGRVLYIQSKALGTPHFVVKGGLTECLDQIKQIIEKNIPVRC